MTRQGIINFCISSDFSGRGFIHKVSRIYKDARRVRGGEPYRTNRIATGYAFLMLARLAEAAGRPLQKQTAEFDDNESISSWAIESVWQIHAAGIMDGTGNNMFAPKQPYAIEQSIVTILRLHIILRPVVELTEQGITDRRLAEMVASGEVPAHVTHLNLSDNSITDVTPLRNLTDLTVLVLWGNQINDVSALSNLTNLTFLALGDNLITDILPLKNLTSLTFLNLRGNPIDQKDIDELAVALPNTYILSGIIH